MSNYPEYVKSHETWEDYPSENTLITADALNNMESGIFNNSTSIRDIDTRINTLNESADVEGSVDYKIQQAIGSVLEGEY